jgi:hypothetical protein
MENAQDSNQIEDKNPDLINSILRNYNQSGENVSQKPPAHAMPPPPQMDMRQAAEFLPENVDEMNMEEEFNNAMITTEQIKRAVLVGILMLVFNNPKIDTLLHRFVKKFIFTDDKLNWAGFAVKAIVVAVIFYVVNYFAIGF